MMNVVNGASPAAISTVPCLRCAPQRETNLVDLNSGTPWETVTLTAFGRNRQVFYDLLEDAKVGAVASVQIQAHGIHYCADALMPCRVILTCLQQSALSKEENRTVIYTGWGTDWRPFGSPKRRRPLDSVILDDGLGERVLADLKEFLTSSQWYTDRGRVLLTRAL